LQIRTTLEPSAVAINDSRRHLNKEIAQLLPQLEAKDFAEARRTLARVDEFRDEFNEKINSIRADMLAQVYSSASTVMRDQSRSVIISVPISAP
jgi:adenylate cyclase